MHNHIQLNKDRIAIGVSSLLGKVEAENLLYAGDEPADDKLGMRYTGALQNYEPAAWEEVPKEEKKKPTEFEVLAKKVDALTALVIPISMSNVEPPKPPDTPPDELPPLPSPNSLPPLPDAAMAMAMMGEIALPDDTP